MNRLWTKNFTIITVGTIVSTLGRAVANFALGLLVLDYTGSTLLYAIYMVCYYLPRVAMPFISGPYMDRFSRKRIVYSLDFLSVLLFAIVALLIHLDVFSYPLLLGMSLLIGSVDSVYNVAYESLYPNLISGGNYAKAYAVSSVIQPIAQSIMVPIAGICYGTIGLGPLFIFNTGVFLISAIFKTRIKVDESYAISHAQKKRFLFRDFVEDIRGGIGYIATERGLLALVVYFGVSSIMHGASSSLVLPFFKSHDFTAWVIPAWILGLVSTKGGLGVAIYSVVMSVTTVGRLIGSFIQYRFRYPANKRFVIAIFVYIAICFTEGLYLFAPFFLMLFAGFCTGIMGTTSHNIRVSSVQNYIPDEKRGRFNGTFEMASMLGTVLGLLTAGLLSEVLPERTIIALYAGISLLSVFPIIMRRKEDVKKIFNRVV